MSPSISELLMNYYDEDNLESLNLFFLANKEFVFRSALYVTNRTLAAEEAVKQSYLNILKRSSICPASIIHDEEKIKSWLLGIILVVARDVLKKDNKKSIVSVHQKSFSHKENLKQKLILEEVLQLPEKLKLPLMLHYRERISVLELSHIYQTNQSQIKNNMEAALDQLKILLKNSGLILTSDLICREIQVIKLPACSDDCTNQIRVENLSKINLSATIIKPNSQPYMNWFIVASIGIPILLVFIYLLDEKYNTQEQVEPPIIHQTESDPIILKPVETNKTQWNFSYENDTGFTILKGFWTHNPTLGFMKTNFNTTSLIQTPFEYKKGSPPLVIKLEGFIFNPFPDREINSRLCGYLISGKKTVKYKFISHVTRISKSKTKVLNGVAIDYPAKLIVHEKGIFVFDKENILVSSMLFTEPLPDTSNIVLGFDNIYTKSLSFEPNAILSNDIETKIKESNLEPVLPTDPINIK